MHNQHAGLSQQLAAQRIAERQEQAAQARLAQSAGRSRRRHRRLTRRWWRLVHRPGAVARTLAAATAVAALIATLSAGQALAGPDERVLERQGRIDRQADGQGKAAEPAQAPSATYPRPHLRPEPPMGTDRWLDTDQQAPPAPAPSDTAEGRTGLAVTLAVAALLLAVGAATTWRIHRRPRPAPTA